MLEALCFVFPPVIAVGLFWMLGKKKLSIGALVFYFALFSVLVFLTVSGGTILLVGWSQYTSMLTTFGGSFALRYLVAAFFVALVIPFVWEFLRANISITLSVKKRGEIGNDQKAP